MTASHIAIALFIAVRAASAEPLGPRIDNLRVDVRCADYWATPDDGLRVTVDGAAQVAGELDSVPVVAYAEYGPVVTWEPTDIGFAVAPGVHRLSIEAPGCAPVAEDIEVSPMMPLFVSGRLPIAQDALSGPAGAPNGIGITLGAYDMTRGPHAGDDALFSSSYAYDTMTVNGLWLATSYEHRGFAFAFDTAMGGGSLGGTAMSTGSPGSFAFTGTALHMGMALRFGARLPRGNFALAAGAGLGGDVWIANAKLTNDPSPGAFIANPGGADADWYIPLWTALTIKPSCNWGTQVLASYEMHPGASNENAPAFMAGVLWQPSAACSQPAGLRVR